MMKLNVDFKIEVINSLPGTQSEFSSYDSNIRNESVSYKFHRFTIPSEFLRLE